MIKKSDYVERRRRIEVGDVIHSNWGCSKARPWLVLWCDDAAQSVCVAAITQQAGFTGVIRSRDAANPFIGSWVMIQPMHIAQNCKHVGRVDKQETRRISAALRDSFDLGDSYA